MSVNMAELNDKVSAYLAAFPGDLICARQAWYEGLGGQGAASPETVAAIEAAIANTPGWEPAGNVRYEKFDLQNSWKKAEAMKMRNGRIMIHHNFKLNGFYREPDGKLLKVVTSEVYNLRCFEADEKGNLTGPMIKIHPTSERAKKLVFVK